MFFYKCLLDFRSSYLPTRIITHNNVFDHSKSNTIQYSNLILKYKHNHIVVCMCVYFCVLNSTDVGNMRYQIIYP